ncbi:phytanoyl-CoA dioxygenase family protein [Nocardia lijiangensis]|uniref:phytanoyl-CoA dioxygenase family protein n=1 Tax=Nocardia lijiangensis TaxID=299618 RepID=UPI003D745A27
MTTLLSKSELYDWNTFGYLHLPGALPQSEVRALYRALMDVHTRFTESAGWDSDWEDVFDAGNDRDLSIANAVSHCAEIGSLLDHPPVFGKILGLMGPYIQVLGSEAFFRYPHEDSLVDFHTDQGPSLRQAAPAAEKEIQLKVQFFLTDLTVPDRGNFTVAPGSHRRDFPGKIAYACVNNPVQILAQAGDVVIFPLSLGHGVAPNRSSTTRVSVVLRYGQIFCRPVDYWKTPTVLHDQLTPRQRRLLGDLGARQRPGDVYGAIPDQLTLVYGQEWSSTAEAQAELLAAGNDQAAYENYSQGADHHV